MTTQLYLHTDKTVICLQGNNPANFLNDLLTAQVEQLQKGIARAACLLSPQGRILFDMLVLRTAEAVYLVTKHNRQNPDKKPALSLAPRIEITHRPEFNRSSS